MKETEALIKETALKILELLEIATPKITLEKDEGDVYHLTIESKDSGILIGYHGENIYALQLILGLIVYQKGGSWQRIVIDVGDWRAKREEQLKRMALGVAQRVKFSGETVTMPFLNAAERRIIHLALAESPDVETYSEGQGKDRRLVVIPKKEAQD